MERASKVLLILGVLLLVVLGSDFVEGGRRLKEEKVDHPQNFIGGIGATGTGGLFPSPGFTTGIVCSYPGNCVQVGNTPFLPTIPGVGSPP
ncbi:Zinc finger, C2H2-like protein [Quillaja saponaria]|uniref:Zinc finger, C2H2-like protein n=1 Tax=Quillaja saponaria TaxID=32244 RepID=A0AAD7QAJ2_QUISA|nr:Zinc finger, C2H2-like protein [Quillaja saponaria]